MSAEPFGFGPTAAIASFFPYLRPHFRRLGFAGSGHTLDLQRRLGYDVVYDLSGADPSAVREVLSGYDALLAADDFALVGPAKDAGLEVILYDPLTWFWKPVPESARHADLFVAQDFFGVAERLRNEPDSFPAQTAIVSPIVERRTRAEPRHVLLNLGGLQNPFWPVDEAARYARAIVAAVRAAVPKDELLVIATSDAVASQLGDGARSYSRNEMLRLYEGARYAFMTSGLGNVYDAASFALPTAWLPPSNDSQGQQLDLLRAHGMTDAAVDWADLGRPVQYRGSQPEVLAAIAAAARDLVEGDGLRSAIAGAQTRVGSTERGSTAGVLDLFGTGGDKVVARLVVEHLGTLR